MGVVIEKTVQVLKLVNSQEHCTLKTLCQVTGYKKSALCQMLRSMVETGLLLKDYKGEYHPGPLFTNLAGERNALLRRQKLIESIAVDLNTASGANITVATLRNGKYRRLFSCSSFRVTRLIADAPDEENFYRNATGRVLLANASAETKLKIIDTLGLPPEKEWSEAAQDQESLLGELEKIRRQKYAELLSPEGKYFFLAVCLPTPPEALPIALGIGLPPAGKLNEKKYLKMLFDAAARFDSEIKE